EADHLVSEHTEAAAAGPGQAGDRATDRGLARAGFADEAVHLTGSDVEADLPHRVEIGTAESARVDDVEVARGHDRLPHLPLPRLGGGLPRIGGRLPASCHGRTEARNGPEQFAR